MREVIYGSDVALERHTFDQTHQVGRPRRLVRCDRGQKGVQTIEIRICLKHVDGTRQFIGIDRLFPIDSDLFYKISLELTIKGPLPFK